MRGTGLFRSNGDGHGFFAENLATGGHEGKGGLHILRAFGTIEIVLFVGVALIRGKLAENILFRRMYTLSF